MVKFVDSVGRLATIPSSGDSSVLTIVEARMANEETPVTPASEEAKRPEAPYAGMEWKTTKGEATNAHSRTIKSYGIAGPDGKVIRKVAYEFGWWEFPTVPAFSAAGAQLSLDDQRKVVNASYKTTARQAANALAITGLGIAKPNEQTDSVIRLTSVYDGLMGKYLAQGMDKDEAHTKARAKASELLEEAWPASDEDDQ